MPQGPMLQIGQNDASAPVAAQMATSPVLTAPYVVACSRKARR